MLYRAEKSLSEIKLGLTGCPAHSLVTTDFRMRVENTVAKSCIFSDEEQLSAVD
jgi:hypothetical protein